MKKLSSKILSVVLVVLLLIQILPMSTFAQEFSATEVNSEEAIEDATVVGEIEELRTESTKHFRMSDGTYIAATYPEPVHYEVNGEWKEIDNTLVEEKVDDQSYFTNKNSNNKVTFSESLSDESVEIKSADGYEISLTPVTDKKEAKVKKKDVEDLTSAKALKKQEKADKKAEKMVLKDKKSALKYSDVFEDTDIEYIITSSTVKENIVVNKPQNKYVYDFNADFGGLTPSIEADGAIGLYNEEKVLVMRIEAPYMYDSTGEISNDVEITYKEKKGQYIVTVTADKKWINDEAREFPVVIDPTVRLNVDRSDINDVYVDSADPTSGHMYSDYLYVGKNYLGTTRTYIKYNLPNLPDCSIVTGAALTLVQYEHDPGSGATNYIYAYDCGTNSWSSESISWNYQPMNKTDLSSYTVLDYQKYVNNTISGNTIKPAIYAFDITKAAKNWYENGVNNGIMLASADTSITKKSRFCSSEYSTNIDYFPSVYVSYVNNSGVEDYWTYQTVDLGRSGCAYIGDYNGTFTYIHDDVSTYGNRMPASVSHVYSSDRTYFNGSYCGFKMGVGFRLNILEQVKLLSNDDENPEEKNLYDEDYRLKHIDSDGTVHYYKSTDEDDVYAHEFNEKLKITHRSDGLFEMVDEKNNKKIYAGGGYLLEVFDSNSNSMTINYINNWLLIDSITDGAGNQITFEYDSSNYLTKISRIGRSINFIYATDANGNNTGYLRSIKYSDNKTTTFYYGGPGGRLDNIVSYDTSDVKFTYKTVNCKTTAFYRISSIETRGKLVDGARSTINKLTYTYGIGETKITDRYGKANYIYFDNAGRTVNIRDHEANSSYARYNSSGNKANTLALQSGTFAHINNLAKNNSAEFTDNGEWYQQIAGAGAGSATISTDYAHIGYKSFKVTNTTTSGGVNFCQALTITPGTDYTLSAYVKIPAALAGGVNSGACLGYSYEAADGTWTTVYDETIKASTDWKRISYTFSLPSDATGDIGIKLIIKHTSGTVYFDCVQLEKGSTMNRYNLLDNSGFDYNNLNWMYDAATSADGIISSGIEGKSVRLYGAPGARKNISQRVQINGKAGDTLVFGGWVKANAAGQANDDSSSTTFKVSVTINYSDGSVEYKSDTFNADVSAPQFLCTYVTLKKDCSNVRLYFTYYYDVNNAVFDNTCLYLDNFGSSYQYDSDGKLVSASDGTGYGITYTYRGHDVTKISQTFDGEEVDGITYDYDDGEEGEGNTHNILSETTKSGIVTAYDYTPREGETSTYGNPTKVTVTSADGTKFSECKMEYTDDYNYLHTVIDSREGTTVYEYNEYNGNLKSVTDPNGNVTTYDYDYVTEELICTGGRASSDSYMTFNYYSYEDDQLYSINHNDFNYIFNTDSFGRTTSTSVAGHTLISHTYNANSTINKSTYGNGDSVSYAYDTLDRVTSLSYNDIKTYEYDYNREGQVAREKDYDNNITTEYEYDLAQRLTGAYSTDGLRANYTYDERNNIKDLAVTKNGTVLANNTFTYQDDGLISSVSLPLLNSSTLTYTYDELNRVTQKKAKSSFSDTDNYDIEVYSDYEYYKRYNEDRTQAVETGLVSEHVLTSYSKDKIQDMEDTVDWFYFNYTYDANGNLLAVYNYGIRWDTFTYDGLNQLVRHDYMPGNRSYVYAYDEGGNITSRTEYNYTTGTLRTPIKTVNYTYDSSWKDKLVSYDGKAITYDEIGNPLTYDGYAFSWQKGRQLASISGNGVDLAFKYNSDGLRTQKISDGITIEYFYSGSKLVAQSDGTNLMRFAYSADGDMIGFDYNGESYYFLKSLQGDVLALITEQGAFICEYIYDAWGNCEVQFATEEEKDNFIAEYNPIRYRGYYYDTETELYYLQSRYYNPEWGRFVNGDGYASTGIDVTAKNMFAYCLNNPIRYVDINGNLPDDRLIQNAIAYENGAYIGMLGGSKLVNSVSSGTNVYNSSKRPMKGDPGSTWTGSDGSNRTFGSDGTPLRDYDPTDHGNPKKHPHDENGGHFHDWSNGKRGPAYVISWDAIAGTGLIVACGIGVAYVTANNITGVGVVDDFLLGPISFGLNKGLGLLLNQT